MIYRRPPILWAAIALVTWITAGAQPHLSNLLVYGDGFAFAVREPQGWTGDTTVAADYSANVIFYSSSAKPDRAGVLIRVSVIDKTDENIQADLEADMKGYRAHYRRISFEDFTACHPTYRTVSKLFAVPGRFYEYVTYVNPGPAKKQLFALSMNKQIAEATSQELAAYREVLASLSML